MGWWSLVGAGGPVIGVSLGSPVIAAFGWRALFWFQLVLIVVAFSVVVIVLPRRRGADEEEAAKKARARQEFKKMDWLGSWSLVARRDHVDARTLDRTFARLDQSSGLWACSC